MKEQRRAAQCVVRSHGKIYCVFNKKYNKFAPIGGKCEPKERIYKTLVREIKEELGNAIGIQHIKKAGIHIHEAEKFVSTVHLFVVDVKKDLKNHTMNEFFLDIREVPFHEELTNDNAYTSLIAIINKLKCVQHA